jgi:hypothetical protein
MREAARDLSSLFGDESDQGRGATALGAQKVTRPRSALAPAEGLSDRLSTLESQLQEAVLRIEAVDQHLATTYQALQELAQKATEPDLFGGVESAEALLDRIEKVVADRFERLSDRLVVFEAQLEDGAVAGRLSALEDRVSSTLSLAELSREAVVRLEKLVASMLGPEVAEEALRTPPPAPPAPPAAEAASSEPDRDDAWTQSDPVAELDALLGAPYDTAENGSPADPDEMYWPSEAEAGEERPR